MAELVNLKECIVSGKLKMQRQLSTKQLLQG